MEQSKDNKSKKSKKHTDLQKKCEEYLSGWQRAQADYHNLQKEYEKKRVDLVKLANADLLLDILPIYDNFKLAFNHIPAEAKQQDWVVGIKHIKNQFKQILEQAGIEEIKAVGEEFDPEIHEAVGSHESTKVSKHATKDNGPAKDGKIGERGIIKREIKSGYKLNGKLLYPAKVIVE